MKVYSDKNKDGEKKSVAHTLNENEIVKSSPGFSDNRPEAIAQRKLQKQVSLRNKMPLQAKLGDAENPHKVDESKYTLLKEENIGDHIIVPNVSGCAAVRVNLFSGSDKEQKLVSSIVFHSDATEESQEKAIEIANLIMSSKYPEKSVGILMITNAQYKSMGEHASKVLKKLTDVLNKEKIPFNEISKALTYDIPDKVNIDMTGDDADILKRYEKSIPSEEEYQERINLNNKYIELLGQRNRAGRHNKKRGRKNNPDYIETPTLEKFRLQNVEERKQTIKALKNNLATESGSCFITTACIRRRDLEDDCEELLMLRDFRDTYLLDLEDGFELIALYYEIAPSIVSAIDKDPEVNEIYDSLYVVIQLCVQMLKEQKQAETFFVYKKMVLELTKKYYTEYHMDARITKYFIQN